MSDDFTGCGEWGGSLEIYTNPDQGNYEWSDLEGPGTNSLIWARVKYKSGFLGWGRTYTMWKLLDNKDCNDFQKGSNDYFNAFDFIRDEDWVSIDLFNGGNDYLSINSITTSGIGVNIFEWYSKDDKLPCLRGNTGMNGFRLDGMSYDSERGSVCKLIRVSVSEVSVNGGHRSYIEEVDDVSSNAIVQMSQSSYGKTENQSVGPSMVDVNETWVIGLLAVLIVLLLVNLGCYIYGSFNRKKGYQKVSVLSDVSETE
eukprot:186133_1